MAALSSLILSQPVFIHPAFEEQLLALPESERAACERSQERFGTEAPRIRVRVGASSVEVLLTDPEGAIGLVEVALVDRSRPLRLPVLPEAASEDTPSARAERRMVFARPPSATGRACQGDCSAFDISLYARGCLVSTPIASLRVESTPRPSRLSVDELAAPREPAVATKPGPPGWWWVCLSIAAAGVGLAVFEESR